MQYIDTQLVAQQS